MTPNTYSIVNELLRGSVTKEQAIAWIEEGRQHAFKNGRAAERIENGEYAVSMEQAFASLATSHELGRKWEAEETIRYAATLMHPKPLVVNGKAVETKMEKPAPTACDKCDGTGWTEGGEGNALGAKCGFCKGFGVAPYQGDVDLKKPPKTRHAIDIRQLVSHLRAANPQVALKAADEAADLIERRILSQGLRAECPQCGARVESIGNPCPNPHCHAQVSNPKEKSNG